MDSGSARDHSQSKWQMMGGITQGLQRMHERFWIVTVCNLCFWSCVTMVPIEEFMPVERSGMSHRESNEQMPLCSRVLSDMKHWPSHTTAGLYVEASGVGRPHPKNPVPMGYPASR